MWVGQRYSESEGRKEWGWRRRAAVCVVCGPVIPYIDGGKAERSEAGGGELQCMFCVCVCVCMCVPVI
jgi:hypothetical protein